MELLQGYHDFHDSEMPDSTRTLGLKSEAVNRKHSDAPP